MSITDNFLAKKKLDDVGRYYVTQFLREVAGQLADGTMLLDAGAGECAYRTLFDHCNYKSVDLAVGDEKWNYVHLDYIAPLDELPIADETFDAIICTQVLEHVKKPLECVIELFRVLKPGGRLFLTVPMSQEEHQVPYDFFRYTSYGLRYLCGEAGFSGIEVKPFGGMFVRWAYEFPRAVSMLPRIGFWQNSLRPIGLLFFPFLACSRWLVPLIQSIFFKLDSYDLDKNDPWGWCLVAYKKAA